MKKIRPQRRKITRNEKNMSAMEKYRPQWKIIRTLCKRGRLFYESAR
jgi:hypothetical protein